ncbi:MAG: MASE1 domain-containing protein [bacterium]|nr:MASE1 domain-containing protein [bacterium]
MMRIPSFFKKIYSSYPFKTGVLAAVYFLTAKFGLTFEPVSGFATLVWPATGIAMAALILSGYKLWPGIFVGAFLANYQADAPLLVAAGIGLGNALEALAAYYLLNRFLKFRSNMERLKDVYGFILLATVLATTLSPTIGIISLLIGNVIDTAAIPSTWWTWWAGDILGALIFAPLLLTWLTTKTEPNAELSVSRRIEILILVITVVFTGFMIFGDFSIPIFYTRSPEIPYQALLPMIWAALRFGPRGTSLTVLGLAIIAIWGTTLGFGPFSGRMLNQDLLYLQMFLGVGAVTSLLITGSIAENKNTQESVKDIARQLNDAQLMAHIGNWEWDINTNIVKWSDELYRVFGITPQEFEGTLEAYLTRVHPEEQKIIKDIIQKSLQTRQPFDFFHRLIRPDGTIHIIHGQGRPIVNSSGKVIRMYGIAQDVTHQKKLQESLEISAKELESALLEIKAVNQTKDEFLAILAHELRNPLAPLKSSLELMHMEEAQYPGIGDSIDVMDRQVEHMSRLLDDLLDISRVSRGKIDLHKECLDAREIVKKAIEDTSTLIEKYDHTLSVEISPEPLWVMADPVRLEQIIINLINNAAKYTPPEGKISVSAGQEDSMATIQVRDTGIGIPPESLSKIFELFSQLDKSLSRREGGLGIGLKLVKTLVELHGGKVEAFSKGPGQGSEFIVRLPLLKA